MIAAARPARAAGGPDAPTVGVDTRPPQGCNEAHEPRHPVRPAGSTMGSTRV